MSRLFPNDPLLYTRLLRSLCRLRFLSAPEACVPCFVGALKISRESGSSALLQLLKGDGCGGELGLRSAPGELMACVATVALLRHRLLRRSPGCGLRRFRSCGPFQRPTPLGGIGDGFSASGAELPFEFRLCGCPRGLLLGLSPSLSLRFCNRFSASRTYLPALAFRGPRRSGGFRGATGERGPEFANL